MPTTVHTEGGVDSAAPRGHFGYCRLFCFSPIAIDTKRYYIQ